MRFFNVLEPVLFIKALRSIPLTYSCRESRNYGIDSLRHMVNVRSPDKYDTCLAMAQSLQTRYRYPPLGLAGLLCQDIVGWRR